ncbi:MAG: hypothetical protein J6C62_02625 [Clostridia bacterium]|nr:hypothetical protein [Clostridia bacterium]
MKKKLLSSLLSLVLCFTLVVGSTYALFTSESKVNIAVSSGTVNVVASVKDVELYSMGVKQTDKFENGGTATVNGGNLALNGVTAGDKAIVTIAMENKSDVTINYHIETEIVGDLAPMLDVKKIVDENGADKYVALESKTSWAELSAGQSIDDLRISIELPVENEDANGIETTTNISIKVIAQQGNAKTVDDTWDGTADTSWYDPANPQTEYTISTAEQIAGLSELVSGNTTFAGVTFTLDADVSLYCEDTTPAADGDPLTFRPIGDHSKNGTFEGTFDGQGHTISKLYQNGWDLGYEWGVYGSYGLFGNVNNATIKNLTLSGGESYIEGGDTSFVAGSATGTCVFENITIEDSISATYNNGNGGIIGWSGAGNYTFKNITIAEDCVLAGLWGSFDSSIGGIVGQAEPGATYNFENVDIACRIDAYNDCTASNDYYNYRMCGMIIGRLEETTTIDGANYPDTSKYNITCSDVTVTYGDWANYHYCEPTPGLNGGRGMRVEPGYRYDGLPADYDHSQCVDNHMNLIPFDQIFGGDQYGVKGLKTYDGVTIFDGDIERK